MLFRTLLAIALLAVCCNGQGGTVEERLKRKSGKGRRRRRLAACPTIYTADAVELEGTDGWNVWSASCAMGSTHTVAEGETVKIKKSASMSGELVIDRGATSGDKKRHFYVKGSLEMQDVTLTGGYVASVSSFVLCLLCDYSYLLFD